MTHQIITTPAGERFAFLPAAEFEALSEALHEALEAAEHANALRAVASGDLETLTDDEVTKALIATTPLAFWREKRDITQKALGAMVGIGQSYVASLERGDRKGDPALFKRLASALRVRMEDLVD